MSDWTQLETSLDIGPDIKPRAAITDKGYDSRANRAAVRKRGNPIRRTINVPTLSALSQFPILGIVRKATHPRRLWRVLHNSGQVCTRGGPAEAAPTG